VCTGHGYLSELVIPIIENTPHEEDLADSLGEAISKYPKATAVLVRRHGIYIWGPTWMAAKTQAECYHYLFKLALEMHRLGIDYTQVSGAEALLLELRRGGSHIKPEDLCGKQTTHVKGQVLY
jgi:ribulose-5-phosphate 4-epimerase/fuculose-1-phosphate aldolase